MASKAGPVLGLIGSIMLLIAGVISIFISGIIVIVLTIIFAILGLIGASMGFSGKKSAGGALLLVAAILALIFPWLGLSAHLIFFIDPILMLIGGILTLALK